MAGSATAMDPFTDDQMQEMYLFALDLGRRAGKILMQGMEKRISGTGEPEQAHVEKMNAVDIVTQTDLGMI
jgi:myo-inositol-1(or 4)-monophosphatase